MGDHRLSNNQHFTPKKGKNIISILPKSRYFFFTYVLLCAAAIHFRLWFQAEVLNQPGCSFLRLLVAYPTQLTTKYITTSWHRASKLHLLNFQEESLVDMTCPRNKLQTIKPCLHVCWCIFRQHLVVLNSWRNCLLVADWLLILVIPCLACPCQLQKGQTHLSPSTHLISVSSI